MWPFAKLPDNSILSFKLLDISRTPPVLQIIRTTGDKVEVLWEAADERPTQADR
jgi:hypothetical protein